jgi:hypothetical protein
VHGELDDPQAVRSNDLGVGIDGLLVATSVVAVGSLDGPAAVSLSLNLEGLVGSLACGITSELAVGRSREVSVVGAVVASHTRARESNINSRLEVDLASRILLKDEDLLLLEGCSIAVDAGAEGLDGQVATSRVDEAKAPGKGIDTGGRHFVFLCEMGGEDKTCYVALPRQKWADAAKPQMPTTSNGADKYFQKV